MAEHRVLWEPVLAERGLSRAEVLRLIRPRWKRMEGFTREVVGTAVGLSGKTTSEPPWPRARLLVVGEFPDLPACARMLALLLADAVRVVCCLPVGPLPCHWRRFMWTTPRRSTALRCA